MAIKTLTEDQVQTWTREQKDRWWLENVFRGDMAQLTIRSAITGFLLGGILSAPNLYIGAKTGWTLGVGLTSVILAFAMFKVFSSLRIGKDMTILENNAMQSIATSAGYMTGPLISGLAAYMMVTNQIMAWWQMLLFNVVLSILGVLVAFLSERYGPGQRFGKTDQSDRRNDDRHGEECQQQRRDPLRQPVAQAVVGADDDATRAEGGAHGRFRKRASRRARAQRPCSAQ